MLILTEVRNRFQENLCGICGAEIVIGASFSFISFHLSVYFTTSQNTFIYLPPTLYSLIDISIILDTWLSLDLSHLSV